MNYAKLKKSTQMVACRSNSLILIIAIPAIAWLFIAFIFEKANNIRIFQFFGGIKKKYSLVYDIKASISDDNHYLNIRLFTASL